MFEYGSASARSQVDDIVSGGDESDDNFRERLSKELDADRIARFALAPPPAFFFSMRPRALEFVFNAHTIKIMARRH